MVLVAMERRVAVLLALLAHRTDIQVVMVVVAVAGAVDRLDRVALAVTHLELLVARPMEELSLEHLRGLFGLLRDLMLLHSAAVA